MHELLPRKLKTYVLAGLPILLFVLFGAIYKETSHSQSFLPPSVVMPAFGWVVAVLGALSILLSFEAPWSWIARPGVLRLLGLPPLLGDWTGSLDSNYPRLDAIRGSARVATEPRYDPDSPDFIDGIPLLSRPASLQIVGSLWHIKVILVTGAAADNHLGVRSESIVARATKEADGTVKVWYVYKAVNHGEPRGNDEKEHLGAAFLSFSRDGTAEGDYWTSRNWRRGMNTAGRLYFRRS